MSDVNIDASVYDGDASERETSDSDAASESRLDAAPGNDAGPDAPAVEADTPLGADASWPIDALLVDGSPQPAEAAPDSADDGGRAADGADSSACPTREIAGVRATTAKSAGFSGTVQAYFALYDVACQDATPCVSSCVAAGGTSASCSLASECPLASGAARTCLPPTYWRYVESATSESNMTTDAAELTLVSIAYQDSLVFTGFAITVPDDAKIVGIKFDARRNADDGLAIDDAVRVLQNGAPVGVDHRQTERWPSTLGYTSYGGSADTWGTVWHAADLRSPGFGLSIAARYTDTAGNDRAHIDAVRATVYYQSNCD